MLAQGLFTIKLLTYLTCSVEIEGLSGSFTVVEPATVSAGEEVTIAPAPAAIPALAPSPEPEPAPSPCWWWAIAGILVIATAGYDLFFIRKKKKM